MNDLTKPRIASRMAHIAPFEVMEIQTLARKLEAAGPRRDPPGDRRARLPARRGPWSRPPSARWTRRRWPTRAPPACAPLRAAIARFYKERYGVEVPIERVVVTAGSSAALLLAFGVVLDAGDEVLLADPGYPCNRHFMRALGAVPKLVPVGTASDYQLTAALAREHWGERTRMAMVATPSNPTGTLIARGEIEKLAQLAREKGGTLLVDEIYHGLTYGIDARTALEAGDDIFVVNSFSKYFQMTGWRLGWLVVPAGLRAPGGDARAEPLHLAVGGGAARGARVLHAGDARHRRSAPRRARPAPAVPRARAGGARLPRAGDATGRVLRLRRLLGAHRPTASPSRARCSSARAWPSRPGRDFGRHEPERHVRIAYTQPIARLKEAVARIGAILPRRA